MVWPPQGMVGFGLETPSTFVRGAPGQSVADSLAALQQRLAVNGALTASGAMPGTSLMPSALAAQAGRMGAGSIGGGGATMADLAAQMGGPRALAAGAPVAEGLAGAAGAAGGAAGAEGLLGGLSLGEMAATAAPPLIGGQLTGQLAQQLLGGNAGKIAGGALRGAGVGGAIGTALFPGLGSLSGAAIGALIGGTGLGAKIPLIGSLFGGASAPSTPSAGDQNAAMRVTIRKLASQLSPSNEAQVRATMKATRSLPREQQTPILTSLISQLPAQIGQDANTAASLKDQLAIQLAMGKAMAGLGEGAISQGDAFAQSLRAQIPNVSPAVQPILENMALQQSQFPRQMSTAWQGAAMAGPIQAAFQKQLSQLAQLTQQQSAQGSSSFASALGG